MQRKKALVIMQGFSFGRFFWLLQITGDQNSPDRGTDFPNRSAELFSRTVFIHTSSRAGTRSSF